MFIFTKLSKLLLNLKQSTEKNIKKIPLIIFLRVLQAYVNNNETKLGGRGGGYGMKHELKKIQSKGLETNR